jgi:hypothetical protein
MNALLTIVVSRDALVPAVVLNVAAWDPRLPRAALPFDP